MKLAFDKDGTITDLKYFPIGKGTKKDKKTILDTAPDIKYENNELIRKVLYHGMALYTKVYPYRPGFAALTQRLAEKGDHITIITSTCMGSSPTREGEKIRTLVELSLINNGIIFHDIIFTKSNKVKESLENEFDIVSEDNYHNIVSLRDAGITTLRMITPQNKFMTDDDDYAVRNIEELEEAIERIRITNEFIKKDPTKRLVYKMK